jgi:uncharacterized membrane protein HdeD (DUF308 family)
MAKVAVVKSWGLRVLAVFLVIWGLFLAFPQMAFANSNVFLGFLAVIAGVLVAIDM